MTDKPARPTSVVEWRYDAPDDEGVDGKWVLIGTPMSVQYCSIGGDYATNEYIYDDDGEISGWVDHGISPRIELAKTLAVTIARNKGYVKENN